jgi:integrase
VRERFSSNHFGARKTRRSPHIYSAAEIDRLIEAALRLRPGLRSRTYATLIALLSVTGLRISEALKLTVADVTRDGLLIREMQQVRMRRRYRALLLLVGEVAADADAVLGVRPQDRQMAWPVPARAGAKLDQRRARAGVPQERGVGGPRGSQAHPSFPSPVAAAASSRRHARRAAPTSARPAPQDCDGAWPCHQR